MKADYLVVGAGAMGMAFTDVLVSETDKTAVMVDRRHRPGGHWHVAYPFVRLHQPSAFYGVNSRRLGTDTIDRVGWNAGLYELATSGEVCAYFDHVMQQQFLPSGRVEFLPMTEYAGGRTVKSLWSGETTEIDCATVVDATYMNVNVPAMRPPPFEVDPSVTCVPLNDLAGLAGTSADFMIIGAGKTGMDACLFLLGQGVEPARIGWVVPRDSWCLNRASIQALDLFEEHMLHWFLDTFEAVAAADSCDDAFRRVEACEQLLRIDPNVTPTMYRCSTVTKAELAELRRVTDVVRLGRVQRIERDRLVLDGGERPFAPGTIHVDCTADGLARRPPRPVFEPGRITLQSVRTCQQVFSAAFTGHVEAAYDDPAVKNDLCMPVPHPDSDVDFFTNILADLRNMGRWAEDEALTAWLNGSRLDGFSQPGEPSPRELEIRAGIAAAAAAAAENIPALLAAAGHA
ncbi:MAG: NAD(P)/FAD-dependent oxidoreductase [Gammaproteobacteria bacterium]